MLAHKIELKPNNKQITYFKKACGISRLAWNWGLANWQEQYKNGLKPSGMSLKKEFNALKPKDFPFTYEVTKYASQQPFIQLQEAYNRFFKKLGGKPKFKKKNKSIHRLELGSQFGRFFAHLYLGEGGNICMHMIDRYPVVHLRCKFIYAFLLMYYPKSL